MRATHDRPFAQLDLSSRKFYSEHYKNSKRRVCFPHHLRVDARRGVRLRVARHGVERDGKEVNRIALALLRLAEPNHPPKNGKANVNGTLGIRRDGRGAAGSRISHQLAPT